MFRLGHSALKYGHSGSRLTPKSPVMANIRFSSNDSSAPQSSSSQLDIRILGYEDVKLRAAQNAPHIHVIDVRDPHELEEGYIPSAKNIPLSVLKEILHLEPDAFKERVGHEKPLPHHELVFYCRSGRRAGVACEAALNHGYRNVVNYKGSWQEWSQREKAQSTESL